VLSSKLNIPPVATLIAVLAGGKLFGVLGVVIAIPLAGTLPVLERIRIASNSQTPAVQSALSRRESCHRMDRGYGGPTKPR
jgi:predicted PurR-regulated permease PerM